MHRSVPGRLLLLAAVCLTPCLPSPGLAAGELGPIPPGAVVRWPEVASAAECHPALLEAAARARATAGAADAAGALPNPALGLSLGEGRPRAGGAGRREWGASIELPLEALATRGPRTAAARAAGEGARLEALQAHRLALRELRRDFVALVHAQAAVEAAAALAEQAGRLAALVRLRVERGEGRPTEAPRAELELLRLQGTLERARAVAEARRRRLSTWLGAPVARAEGDLGAALPLAPLEQLRAQAVEASPAVQAARARVESAAREASAERWERLPKVTLGGARSEELDRTASALTATLTLPLWNWNQGRIRQAEAVEAAERARLDGTAREAGAALDDAWLACQAGQAAAGRFQAEVLPRAEASARTLGRAYELGEAGLLDVLDARRVLLDTRREHLDLLLDMQTACGDLAALAGLELP